MYSYEKTKYINTRTPVIITCEFHGDFKQLPWAHHRGMRCPKCADTRKTTDQFIKDSKKVHGNKYTYADSVYINARSPIIITCQIHGNFTLKAVRHTSDKNGCPKCSGRNKTTEEFIEKSKAIYGEDYTYKNTEYKGCLHNIAITCKIHGDFTENTREHIRPRAKKKGCPLCSKDRYKKLIN